MKTAKKVLAPLAFLLALLCAVGLTYDTLLMKRYDGIVPMKALYDQPQQSVDVLLLGSSYVGKNVSMRTLWEGYGIAGFDLWGALQPFWNSYYDLIEALKTQQPKLVLLEVSAAAKGMHFPEEYSEEERQVVNVAAMRPSLNKWRAIQATAPPERWLDLMTVLPITHTRYDELTEEDFAYFPWQDLQTNKGAATVNYTFPSLTEEAADVRAITQTAQIAPKEELYLNKIIELCRQKDLTLLLFKTPLAERAEFQPYFNRVEQIAREQGVDYLDMNRYDDKTGFVVMHDVSNDDWHLNTYGAVKTADFLGAYIKENYDIPDRRGDAKYASWEQAAREEQNSFVQQITGVSDYFAELADSPYLCYLVKDDACEMTKGYRALTEAVKSIDDAAGDVVAALQGTQAFDAAVQCTSIDGEESHILPEEEKTAGGFSVDHETQCLYIDGEMLCYYGDGDIMLLLYDPWTEKYLDLLRFSAAGDYALERCDLEPLLHGNG